MSHPSKLDFIKSAKEQGFRIYLYFVALNDPEMNKGRVETRVLQGGHDVPANKISIEDSVDFVPGWFQLYVLDKL